ncbi:MAG: tyrosine-type recombinase/integrase [Thermoflexus hugenholtzii]|jgi:integrase/recombinase XerD|uniref:tyrosine-type recombinase/integrase n=1 Tax=Thermoflexus TaxID=1495649 RepID=UPI001C748D00|nr:MULTISPECIES: tyrosine-type recombinase/integrase [Thermoflexus]QWK10354.1 MAG: tyrosine-type recombinase/integrase [Thermoflexus hugenholtzii]
MAHQPSLFEFKARSELTPETPLARARQAFADHLKGGDYSRHTVYFFTHDLRLLGQCLGEDRPVGTIGLRDLQDFVDWLRHRRGVPCTPKSLRRRITAVKAFFRWLHEELGVLPTNPAEALVYPEAVEPLPEVLTPEQVRAVREAAEGFRREGDARPLTLLTLLLHTGLKKSEVVALRLEHFDLREPAVWIRYAHPRYRHKERRLPLPPEWPELFREYLQQYRIEGRVFPWTPRNLEYVLDDVARRAGMAHLSFETLRWTCALQDFIRGMDPEDLRQKLGLSEIQWRDTLRRLQALAGRFAGS